MGPLPHKNEEGPREVRFPNSAAHARYRIRKVKCDETKPYCLRCTKTGRKCDGYLDPKTIASRRRTKDDVPLSVMLEWASPDEKRSFHFFQHVTAPSLSGDLDGVFWRVLVLQICQREAAVRHAVLAVSSLHEGLLQGPVNPYADDANPKQSFALQQYNKAIACLLDQMNDPISKPMGPLLTCVLFVCIEFMQSKDKESLIHLEQGRQILSRLERRAESRDPEIEVIKQHLVPMYTRLSMTSFLFGGTPVPIPQSLKTVRDIPVVIESLQEMRYALHDFIDRVLRFTQRSRPAKYSSSVPPEVMRSFETEQQHLLSQLAKLNISFSLYQATRPAEAAQTTSVVLQIYLHTTKIWISTALSKFELAYDDHLDSFSAIVPLAAGIINAEASSAQNQARRAQASAAQSSLNGTPPREGRPPNSSIFAFETHVIPALYFVATKCRHPLVRHAALSLLKRNPSRRENLWRADVIGGIAAHVVNVEERWISRPKSPSNIHPIAPYSNECTPESIYKTGMPGLPVPEDFRADTLSHTMETHISELGLGLIVASPMPPGTPAIVPLLAPDDSDFDLDPPIDPALLMELDAGSPHSFSGAASFTSHDDHLASDPTLLFDPTSITVKYAAEGQHKLVVRAASTQPGQLSETRTAIVSHQSSGHSDPSSGSDNPHDASSYHHQHHHHMQQSTEAPFDLPEHLRVRDAIIGPEKEDGSWVTVFRKLHGLTADWDVQTEYVPAL